MEFRDYKKYRWFYTSSGKLVVGGKSSSQNDELIKKLKAAKRNFIVMHTSSPGSPFSVILSDDIDIKDKKECAVFTACFSRAWKQRKKRAKVDIFTFSQLYKLKEMKTGTWGVKGKVQRVIVGLSLVLTKQNSSLRAVPESAGRLPAHDRRTQAHPAQ